MAPRTKRAPKGNGKPTAVEQPIMASVLFDVQEMELLLAMLRQVNFPDPLAKHVAANIQTKAAQAAAVFPQVEDQA